MTILNSGDKAPDFDLPQDDGSTVSLKNLLGHKIILYFYPKDDTSGCTQEALEFNQLKSAFTECGAVIFGVSPDSVKSHIKFKAKHNLDFALISDESKSMLESYGVWTEKSMYGRKYMGVERTSFLIDESGFIMKVWPKVKVAGHPAEILSFIKTK
jgi:thioredoxin-dependent peroxiredoxin